VLVGLGRGDGALWAHVGELLPVGTVQRGRGRREGGPGGFFPLLPCLTAWVGAEGAGARPRGSLEHGYRAGAKVNSVGHSDFDFLDVCPPGA
jgi:hypothetical protein